ncbi:ATP-binding protein [Streptomyces sp. NPDC094038]|uniref:ATP-binding protein n=1 Tax=Streptomyces sp. NPDC094038 TaxID=3366055 RepID=UPI003804F8E4
MSRVAEVVGAAGEEEDALSVILSSELIGLLSEQLYKSPIKALEELVVNAYDADASECRIGLPTGGGGLFWNAVFVFDDGSGMDHAGLADLWHVGHSKKRGDRLSAVRQRKQIGKFGIGKLATYSLAYQVTYLTRVADEGDYVRATTLDYREFLSDPRGGSVPVTLPVRRFPINDLLTNPEFESNLRAVSINPDRLAELPSWTLVILEDLRDAVQEIQRGRLEWVLSTAMPLGEEFKCYINDKHVKSSKEDYDVVTEFSVAELPEKRISRLKETTGEDWKVQGGKLACGSFPSGIEGRVLVTLQSLYGQKSDDLVRSNGFFVRVRGRLVNVDDPLFGMRPLSYETLARFRADITADDLDEILTAPREGVEQGNLRKKFTDVLETLFYEARSRYEQYHQMLGKQEKHKNEGARNYVNPRYVERPVADALIVTAAEQVAGTDGRGADADGEWFYLDLPAGADLSAIASGLYSDEREVAYRYDRVNEGRSARMVKFDPEQSIFYLNADHDLVRSHDDNPGARKLLEDMVSAEALLEVYLREKGMTASAVGEVLEQRDQLLRSLTRDNVYSIASIAQQLRDSGTDERDLEVNLVVAARALGFVAKHLSGAKNPDGIARLADYPDGEKVITLEAKSSKDVPSLGAIDFAGLLEHVRNEHAHGCLLVAPSYPGSSAEDSAAARRAEELKISCWTVEQLSDVLAAAENRHVTARHILNIVLNYFRPDSVANAVKELLDDNRIDHRMLYRAVILALRKLDGKLLDQPRTRDAVTAIISLQDGFEEVKSAEVRRAIEDLAGASQGGMTISGERIIMHVSVDELSRRVAPLLGDPGESRGPGTFRL